MQNFVAEHYTRWQFWIGTWLGVWALSIHVIRVVNKVGHLFDWEGLPAHTTALLTFFWPLAILVGVCFLTVVCLALLYEKKLGCAKRLAVNVPLFENLTGQMLWRLAFFIMGNNGAGAL